MAKLKRVTPSQVTLGMFIHKFEGGWMSHPFWRAGFVVEDDADLQQIRESAIAALWIDEAKGIVEEAPVARREMRLPSAEELAERLHAARSNRPPLSPQQSRLQDERLAVVNTIARSKQIVKQIFDGVRFGKPIRSADVMPAVKEISTCLTRNRAMLLNILRLKTKDEYTYLHSVAVCTLMINLGREIGLDEAVIRDAGVAGLLHDVGKMAISKAILNKPERLTEDEFTEIQSHTTKGHALLAKGTGIPDIALDVCLHHHEKMDGTGYPKGLPGDDISLFARMGAICDVYDAMTSRRSYKAPCTPTDTIAAMHATEGHFDPLLLFRFMQSIGAFPTGMLVRLESGRLGVIVENGRRGFRVRVKAFYDIAGQRMIAPEEIIINDIAPKDVIISEEQPEAWNLPSWPFLRDSLLSESRPTAQAA